MDSGFNKSQRRSATPPKEGAVVGTRSRSPRRAGGGRDPQTPESSPRRDGMRSVKASAPSSEDDFPILASYAMSGGGGQVVGSRDGDGDMATQHKDLMRRFSEKCAQLREAHAARCGLELRLSHVEALGPKGSVRQRLLAAEAAATAATAELQAERQRAKAREAEILALVERGALAELKTMLTDAAATDAPLHGSRCIAARFGRSSLLSLHTSPSWACTDR